MIEDWPLSDGLHAPVDTYSFPLMYLARIILAAVWYPMPSS